MYCRNEVTTKGTPAVRDEACQGITNGDASGLQGSKLKKNSTKTRELPPQETFVSKFTSCRWTTCYMCFVASLLLYTFRHCLSMAFVCMETAPSLLSNWTENNFTNTTGLTANNVTNSTIQGSEYTEDKRYNPYVPAQLEGTLLSSYFYGYLLTPLVGGTIASKFGPKRVVATSLTIASTAIVLFPLALRTNIYLGIAMRIIVGLSSGTINPSLYVMWSHWAPIYEKSQLAAVTNSGVNMASILVTAVSASLCEIAVDDGWPFIFYVYGEQCQGLFCECISGCMPPWMKIFKSPPFWALLTAHISQTWIETTITTFIPMYMNDVLKFKIEENGLLSSLPFIGRFLGGIVTAYIADLMQSKAVMKTTYTRKMFQTIGSVIPASLLIGVSYLNTDQRVMAVGLLTLTMTVNSTTIASFRVNHLDIAPRYSGQIMGFTQTFAIVGGIVSPLVTAAITIDGTREQWQIVFIITATIVLFSNIVFVLFGSGREQAWAKFKEATIDIPRMSEQNHSQTVNAEQQNAPHVSVIHIQGGGSYDFVYDVKVDTKNEELGKVNTGFDGDDSGIVQSEEGSNDIIETTRM
ncbi:sialin-like [Haliotis rubra]|uniref:sialin-like n=1 Tax=Haliotis rubra TaxID=36100 RepID=UPI001EE5036D|nr:sialin-like [Haliotis rubra]